MDVILPAPGKIARVERRIAGSLKGLLSNLDAETVELSMPKVKLASRFELAEPLRTLGIRDLFSGRADLSGITTEEPIRIGAAVHRRTSGSTSRGRRPP